MNPRNIIIVAFAVLFGLIAVYLANVYFSNVEERSVKLAEQAKLTNIVVASQDMAFGTPLSVQNTRLAAWPEDSVPKGAFTTIKEATDNRVVLRPIVIGEPLLASKVSGVNGRATLSANLPEGMVAFTIPISANAGVGGYVRPGDIVEVLLTRQIPGDGMQGDNRMTDVVLQAVPVLGIDLVSDENQTQPAVGKTATLQVSVRDAQKLALATKIGSLDLALRNVADQAKGRRATVIPRDLTASRLYLRPRNSASSVSLSPTSIRSGPSMTVVRGTNPTDYEVRRGY